MSVKPAAMHCNASAARRCWDFISRRNLSGVHLAFMHSLLPGHVDVCIDQVVTTLLQLPVTHAKPPLGTHGSYIFPVVATRAAT